MSSLALDDEHRHRAEDDAGELVPAPPVPVALAAVVFKIPVAHIHGGETSQGAIDEAFRHAVTKMASIHFPANDVYRNRILQMGEPPELTFNFGAPGLDSIYRLPMFDKEELEESLQFRLDGTVALVTFHPVTIESGTALVQVDNLLKAIKDTGIRAVFTKANADADGSIINGRLAEFCQKCPDNFKLFDSLGQKRYLSCMKTLDLMLGNSSSGLIEAPSFRLPVVNIGDRQKGRMRAANVIDVGNSIAEIKGGIERAISMDFKKSIETMVNPNDVFQDGKTSRRIKEQLKIVEISEKMLKKEFRDIL